MRVRVFAFFALLLFCAFVGKSWHWMRDGFSLRRICFPLIKEKNENSLDERILNQPFTYLGRGHQNFAFVSKDMQYVLKIPRYDIYRAPFWMRSSPFLDEMRKEFLSEKMRRYSVLINSFTIAEKELKEETALLFLHLHATDHFNRKIALIDPIGRKFFIDLDKTGFLLQKRCDLFIPTYLKAKKIEKKKELLDAFLNFHAKRARKAIHNKDPSFMRNFAFAEHSVIQIDVGSFYREENQDLSTSFFKHVGHFQDFLKEQDPEMEEWFIHRAKELWQQ